MVHRQEHCRQLDARQDMSGDYQEYLAEALGSSGEHIQQETHRVWSTKGSCTGEKKHGEELENHLGGKLYTMIKWGKRVREVAKSCGRTNPGQGVRKGFIQERKSIARSWKASARSTVYCHDGLWFMRQDMALAGLVCSFGSKIPDTHSPSRTTMHREQWKQQETKS